MSSCNKLVPDEVELTRRNPYSSELVVSLSINDPDMSMKYVPVEANVILPDEKLTMLSGSKTSDIFSK